MTINFRLIIGVVLATSVSITFESPARAQETVGACLSTPNEACITVLNDDLAAREQSLPSGQERVFAQFFRVSTFVAGNRPDLAEAILDEIPANVRDSPLFEIVAFSKDDVLERGQRLLPLIKSHEYYTTARGHYIENLVDAVDLETVMAELVATDRYGEPITFTHALALAQALAVGGRVDDAIGIVALGTLDNERYQGPHLHGVITSLLAVGKLADAERVIDQIKAPMWRAIAKGDLARALHESGATVEATAFFAQSRDEMATLELPNQRLHVYGKVMEAAIDVGRFDFAVDAARDVSTFPIDHAFALAGLLEYVGEDLQQSRWQPVVDQVVTLLDSQPNRIEGTQSQQNDTLSRVSCVVAMAGDIDQAVNLNRRITDTDWRDFDLEKISMQLFSQGNLEGAFALLAGQRDFDKQAQGYIQLSKLAAAVGNTALAQSAIAAAMELVDGPERVSVGEETIVSLANYEASIGRFQDAAIRLRDLSDIELQAKGHIAQLGFAAAIGSREEYENHLAAIRAELDGIEDHRLRHALLDDLVLELIYAGKSEPIVELVFTIRENTIRDTLLQNAGHLLTNKEQFSAALVVVSQISDSALRAMQEHNVLLGALRVSLAS